MPDITAHLGWATKLGKTVAREYHFRKGGQEEDDIIAVAYLHLHRCGMRYTGDPANVDHFRGYAHPSLVSECRREARRLRNGGTYWVRQEKRGEVIDAAALSDLANADGDPFDAAAATAEDAVCPWAR